MNVLEHFFLSYEYSISTKIKSCYLSFLKHEHKMNKDQSHHDLVNKFIQEIELPKELIPIMIKPSFDLAVELYYYTRILWNDTLSHYPDSSFTITKKKPCESEKMLRYAKALLEKSGDSLELQGMSYEEIKYIIDKYKD